MKNYILGLVLTDLDQKKTTTSTVWDLTKEEIDKIYEFIQNMKKKES